MTDDFSKHLAELRESVEGSLDQLVRDQAWPESLRGAVKYSLMAGGKRLRPALVLLAADLCQGKREAALPAAMAIECIHTYSLIHDDLPCMDDDDLRRGRPTSHVVFGEALATLAGDSLLTLAFESFAHADLPAAGLVESLKVLGRAAGGAGMVGGQILDLEAERGPFPPVPGGPSPTEVGEAEDNPSDSASESPQIRVEQLTKIHRMKTGALINAALELGAISANASIKQRAALVTYGRGIGLAFQIADDLLDVTGTNERLGKETGRDDELGKLTYPSLLGIEASRARAAELIDQACAALNIFEGRQTRLVQLARFIVERDH